MGGVEPVADLVVLGALVGKVDIFKGNSLGLHVVFLVEGLVAGVFQKPRLYLANVNFERSC